jgi:DNA-directed RNA polymerase subunit RPC12/RpoP
MDYRCPNCEANLRRRKLSQTVVARMHIDCPRCKSTIRLNIHRVEGIVVMFSFGTVVVLGALAYLFQSQGLVVLALGTAMLGALAFFVLERTYLKAWPRYASTAKSPNR